MKSKHQQRNDDLVEIDERIPTIYIRRLLTESEVEKSRVS